MKTVGTILFLALVLTTTSCSQPAATTSETPAPSSVTESPTQTPTPTPTAMTPSAAGAYYLATVCKSNAAGAAMTTVVHTDPFDLAASREKAGVYRDALRQVILEFTKPDVLWPESVKPDVAAFVEGLYEEMSHAESLSADTEAAAFNSTWNAWTDPAAPNPSHLASQKVRLKLGLSADAHASCGM